MIFKINKRGVFSFFVLLFCISAVSVLFTEKFDIEHPIKNPLRYTDKEKCDNCSMSRNKWARTRYEFETSKGKIYTCSIHCVVVMSMRLKEEPKDVKVAEYLCPERMIDADKAFYVIDSTAPGTMTKRSKITFSTKEKAEKFAARYGGTVAMFEDALSETKKEVHIHKFQ
ncbi:MAG: nitrous oxide reductase accessory protein NosL [Nitrospirota bacterium]